MRHVFFRALHHLLLALVLLASLASQPLHAGTTNYPDAGLQYGGSWEWPTFGGGQIACMVQDPAAEYVYLGIWSSPGRILKVDLRTKRPVAEVQLAPGEDFPRTALIDPQGHNAYFSIYSDTATKIVRINLDNFARTDALPLGSGEVFVQAAIIDREGTSAYFATGTAPGRIVRVDLPTFTRVAAITLDPGEDYPTSAVCDLLKNDAYFGTSTTPARVVKLNLRNFLRERSIVLPNESTLRSAIIDPETRTACFGTRTTPARVVQINLETFTRKAEITLPDGVNSLETAAMDPWRARAYFVADTTPPVVVGLSLAPLHLDTQVELATGEGAVRGSIVELGSHTLYVGTAESASAVIARVDVVSFARMGGITLRIPTQPAAIFNDPIGNAVCFVTSDATSTIVKIDRSTMNLIGTFQLAPLEQATGGVAVDPVNSVAYLGAMYNSNTRRIVKVDFVNMKRLDSVDVDTVGVLRCGDWSPAHHTAYFGTSADPAELVLLDADQFRSTITGPFIGGDSNARSLHVDDPRGWAYVAVGASPGRVIRVSLTDGQRSASRTVSSFPLTCSTIDTAGGFAYYGSTDAITYKLDLATFQSSLLKGLSTYPRCAVFDSGSGMVYFGNGNSSTGTVAAVTAPNNPSQVTVGFPGGGQAPQFACIDSATGETCFSVGDTHARIVKLAARGGGALHGTKTTLASPMDVNSVRLYSHSAGGHVRLAIYRDGAPYRLLWQSADIDDDVSAGWLDVPIEQGIPQSLSLPTGQYWLAWQSTSPARVASFVANSQLQFAYPQRFGMAPSELNYSQVATSTGSWEEALVAKSAQGSYDFAATTQGWEFHDLAPTFTPPGHEAISADSGALRLTSTDNVATFGWWESAPFPVTTTSSPSNLQATFRLRSNQTDRTTVPTIRLRSSLPNNQQADVLAIESNDNAALSPATGWETTPMYWSVPRGSTQVAVEFDLLNFTSTDSPTASVDLDRVDIQRLPDDFLSSARLEKEYTFTNSAEGFTAPPPPSGFVEIQRSWDGQNGRLDFEVLPADGFAFSWWGSPESESDAIHPQSGRLYVAQFTVGSDQADPAAVPCFRLRVNDSRFRASQSCVVTSTAAGNNSPTLGNLRTYSVVFPSEVATSGHLIYSMDVSTRTLDRDATTAHLYLENLVVRSFPHSPPNEQRIALPGGVPMDLVRIPRGTFLMGSDEGDEWSYCASCEKPVHPVTIPNDFYMGKFEVTQAQWMALMGNNPSFFNTNDQNPVENVTWEDAKSFIAALNNHLASQGQTGITFRLPSESEWEYACRAGTETRYSFGDSNCTLEQYCDGCNLGTYAWFCGNGSAQWGTKPVGQLAPNPLGLYDMHGNAWEWCEDYLHLDGYIGAPTDGTPWLVDEGAGRVVRGGCWVNDAKSLGSAHRFSLAPAYEEASYGFRLAADLAPR